MKKLIAMIFCFVLAGALAACGAKPVEEGSADKGEMNMTNSSVVDTKNDQVKTTDNSDASTKLLFQKPPVLTVSYGENASVEALMGTYSWMYPNEKGALSGDEADSLPTLLSKEYMPFFTNPDRTTVQLKWETRPDEVSVHCWSGGDWGQSDAPSEECEVHISDTEATAVIELRGGNYIYEVRAGWDIVNPEKPEKGFGTAYYSFYTIE